jgi:hypothetical protein
VGGWLRAAGAVDGRPAGRWRDCNADPDLIKWCLQFVRQGAESGRDFSRIKIASAAPIWISDDWLSAAIACAGFRRWWQTTLSDRSPNTIGDAAPELTAATCADRQKLHYLHHAGSRQQTPIRHRRIVDRYDIIGRSMHISAVGRITHAGVHQFNIYLMSGDEESQVRAYSKSVIPHFNRKIVRAAKPTAAAKAKRTTAGKTAAKRRQ